MGPRRNRLSISARRFKRPPSSYSDSSSCCFKQSSRQSRLLGLKHHNAAKQPLELCRLPLFCQLEAGGLSSPAGGVGGVAGAAGGVDAAGAAGVSVVGADAAGGVGATVPAAGAATSVCLLYWSCMMPAPIGPSTNQSKKATTPVILPFVTFSTPSQYFQSHQMLTNGTISSQEVGMSAPRETNSPLVLTAQYTE